VTTSTSATPGSGLGCLSSRPLISDDRRYLSETCVSVRTRGEGRKKERRTGRREEEGETSHLFVFDPHLGSPARL